MFVIVILIATVYSIQIPLNFSIDPRSNKKYDIHYDFNDTKTYYPVKANILSLGKVNLSLDMSQHEYSFIKVGLKYPSDFIVALSQFYHVNDSQVEFGLQPDQQLFINEVNFIEGRDEFQNGGIYNIKVEYNYGKNIYIRNQACELIDGSDIFLNEYMILEVLNSMSPQNKLKYTRKDDTLVLSGNINNLPHLFISYDQTEIPIEIKGSILRINQNSNTNKIGIKTLKSYSKIQVKADAIVLKRSAFNIVLYIFLGLFVAFSLILTIYCWQDAASTFNFVRNLIKSFFFKDNRARVEILMVELE